MEIEKRDNSELILDTIGAHWSPLELDIMRRDNAELIHVVITIEINWSSRFRRETILS